MPELTHKERLQPSLIDRLTDNARDKRQESNRDRVLSTAQLRDSVRRDLVHLFNTVNLAAVRDDLDDYPFVQSSVLNYGLPDLAGRTTSGIDGEEMERLLKQAILDFEPRLMRNTVKVRLLIDDSEMSHNAMSFSIEAQLWAQPMPLQLFMRTDVDLENGSVSVTEASPREDH